jgi:hypothetical protein
VNFFRPSGINQSLAPTVPAQCMALVQSVEQANGLGVGVPVPFSDMVANYSNGSSVYHGLTANLRKSFTRHYELLASYTWSHTIDDSTDLQSPLAPQDNSNPAAERSNSLFDQRHRFVFSAVYQSGSVGSEGLVHHLLSNWTVAPVIEASSGRPFNILTGSDRNFDFGPNTDRPLAVAGAGVNACGDAAVASKFSPTGWLQPACWVNGTLVGNLGRNQGRRPNTFFNDLRVSRHIKLTERFAMDAIADMFNLANHFNVADVNPLYTNAGQPTAAFDPRQFQFALKVNW